jgi:Mrp family chromosome partitioning ATPase
VADAQILGRQAQGVLLVIDAERTQRTAAMRAVDALRQVGANLLGAVVNRLSHANQNYYDYNYQYYYYRDDSPPVEGQADSEESREEKSRRQPINGTGHPRQPARSVGG